VATTGRPCKAKNARGEPCGAYAMRGSKYCFHHDPAKAEERKVARTKGGRARHGRTLAEGGNDGPVQIETVADVVDLLVRTINDVLSLENSIQRARAIGYLAGVVVKALEVAELEERVAALEAALKTRRG
jgi:hypothetical protein